MKPIQLLLPSLVSFLAAFCYCEHAELSNGLKVKTEVNKAQSKQRASLPISATENNLKATMETAFRPLFENLKKQIGVQSKSEEVDFENVRFNSLLVSELLARLHQWPAIAKFESDEARRQFTTSIKDLAIRETQADAKSIYEAAKQQQFKTAQQSFVSMTTNCNICHKKRKASWVPVVLIP